MSTWKKNVIMALQNLGGSANLSKIYDEVNKIRGGKPYKTLQQKVRQTLYTHSSDSDYKITIEDLFYLVGDKFKGIWGLRNYKKPHSKKYYWVNQGRTWKAERSEGFLWAPFLTRSKRERDDWIVLKKLNPGDIIFSYVTPNLLAYSIVTNKWIEYDRPREFDKNLPWTKEGMRVDVKYVDFNPIKVDSDFKNNVLVYKDTFDDGKDWIFDINMKIKHYRIYYFKL